MSNFEKLQYFRNQQMRLSGRLRALSFKTLRNSEIDIADAATLDQLFTTKSISLPINDALKLLSTKERKYIAETGRSELYLATCFISSKKLGIKAPLILIPITLEKSESKVNFTLDDEAIINKLLIYKIAIDSGISTIDYNFLDTEQAHTSLNSVLEFQNLIAKTLKMTPESATLIPTRFTSFNESLSDDMLVEHHFIIAQMPNTTSAVIYDYTRLMAQDELSQALNELINQQKIAPRAPISYFQPATTVSSNASQDTIINTILAGNNTIVQGPPGTGKSQLIANLIFQALLNNKRILFVSEKKTAIDVVDKRIGGLSNYAMYMSDIRDKQAFFDRIKSSVSMRTSFSDDVVFNQDVPRLQKESITELTRLHARLKLQQFANSEHAQSNDSVYAVHSDLPRLKQSKERKFNQLFENYLQSKSHADLAVIECYLQSGKYPLYKRFLHLFKKEIKGEVSTLEKDAMLRYINQGSSNNIAQLASSVATPDVTQQVQHAYDITAQAVAGNNTNATAQLNRLLRMFTPSDALLHVSRLKTYPRKTLYNFAHENLTDLLTYFPIWIASLDAALEVLPQQKDLFDYIIVDEGSQVEYSKILPLINRAKHYVVVGDKMQLRSMDYFSSALDFDQMGSTEMQKEMENFEEGTLSIIDFAERVIDVKNTHMLSNHYRSSDSRLIAFSNAHFYENKMNVVSKMDFYDPNVIEVIDVEGKFESDSGTNPVEITTIIDTMTRLFTEKKGKSIGIVVMNKQMEEAVDRAIENAISSNSTFKSGYEAYYSTENIDSIIIKNLESIQGDERDIIIFALTYGVTDTGRLNNLGPITYAGGKNRINVAITRSKEKMVVIKSLKASQFTADAEHSEGRHIFRDYIAFLDAMTQKSSENTSIEGVATPLINAIHTAYPNKYHFEYPELQGIYHIHLIQIDSATNQIVKGYVFTDQAHWSTPFSAYYYHQFLTDRKWSIQYVNTKRFADSSYITALI